MSWRLNDVLVGIITGAICSVLAALIEGFIVQLRFFSLGHLGGGVGSKVWMIGLIGALLGGSVGWFLGAVLKPRGVR